MTTYTLEELSAMARKLIQTEDCLRELSEAARLVQDAWDQPDAYRRYEQAQERVATLLAQDGASGSATVRVNEASVE